MPQRIASYCAQCRSRCGVVATVEAGRLTGIEADPSHPSGHKICPKGRAAPELVYAPERLLWPVKRTNPKGAADPGWQRISWDEALATAAERLQAVKAAGGAEAVAFAATSPSASAISDSILWIERLIRAFGSPNIIYATELCNWHKDFAPVFTFGSSIGLPDFANSDCILLWGHNPLATWLAEAGEVQKGLRKGAKLIVVDPRPAGFARRADAWLRVRPGTDCVLALGLANLLLEAGRFDRKFLTDWSNGPFLVREDDGRFLRDGELLLALAEDGSLRRYDPGAGQWRDSAEGILLEAAAAPGGVACRSAFARYRARCAAFPPERVAALTDVAEPQLREAARLLGEARSVAHYCWTGVGQHSDATQTSRAIALLYALTGSYDAPGGNVLQPGLPLNDVSGKELLPAEQRAKTLGLAARPLGPGRNNWVTGADAWEAMLEGRPYPVRALVAFGSNLLLSQPGVERARQALRSLDFFLHLDGLLTPTAAEADIVLPVASGWEREGLRAGFDCSLAGQFHLQLKPAVVPPLGESRSDTAIVFELATRLGLGRQFFDGDSDRGLAHQLAPTGVSLEALRATPGGLRLQGEPAYRRYRTQGFATPTRRLELYSEALLAIGQAPLPDPAPAPLPAGFDLTLTCAKGVAFCHSQHRHIPALRRLQPEPQVEIHPATAAAAGIAAGDRVRVETPTGSFRAAAKLTPGLHPRTLCGQHGWWEAAGAANMNLAIALERADPISGALPLRSTPCRIRRLDME